MALLVGKDWGYSSFIEELIEWFKRSIELS